MLTITELPKPTKTNSVEAKAIEVGDVFLGKDGTWGRVTTVCKPEKGEATQLRRKVHLDG